MVEKPRTPQCVLFSPKIAEKKTSTRKVIVLFIYPTGTFGCCAADVVSKASKTNVASDSNFFLSGGSYRYHYARWMKKTLFGGSRPDKIKPARLALSPSCFASC
jgi:hypothetical protein